MPKATEAYCKSQIMRLSSTSFFPSQMEGIAELVGTLKRNVRSDQHAKRVIDAALEASSNCPTPHDIVQLCRQVREADEPELPGDCRECAPYDGNWRLVITKNGNEGIERCFCVRGRALAAKDAERRAAEMKSAAPKADSLKRADLRTFGAIGGNK